IRVEEVGLRRLGEVLVGVRSGVLAAVFSRVQGILVELPDIEVVGGRDRPTLYKMANFVEENVEAGARAALIAEQIEFINGGNWIVCPIGNAANVAEERVVCGVRKATEFRQVEHTLGAVGNDDVSPIHGEEFPELVIAEHRL